MSFTDPIGDMLTRVRNASSARHEKVLVPASNLKARIAEVLKAAGVTGDYTFHSWRHTFRTRLAEAGVSDELAKRLGGWTVDKTAMRYDHDGRIAELRAAVEQGAQASG